MHLNRPNSYIVFRIEDVSENPVFDSVHPDGRTNGSVEFYTEFKNTHEFLIESELVEPLRQLCRKSNLGLGDYIKQLIETDIKSNHQ